MNSFFVYCCLAAMGITLLLTIGFLAVVLVIDNLKKVKEFKMDEHQVGITGVQGPTGSLCPSGGTLLKVNFLSTFDWKLLLIFILSLALVFILGRTYQGNTVDSIVLENTQLKAVIQQTDAAIKQVPWSPQDAVFWQRLGYSVPSPKPLAQPVPEKPAAPAKK
jgi:hypothetical protein